MVHLRLPQVQGDQTLLLLWLSSFALLLSWLHGLSVTDDAGIELKMHMLDNLCHGVCAMRV